jgi:hypothetical protein
MAGFYPYVPPSGYGRFLSLSSNIRIWQVFIPIFHHPDMAGFYPYLPPSGYGRFLSLSSTIRLWQVFIPIFHHPVMAGFHHTPPAIRIGYVKFKCLFYGKCSTCSKSETSKHTNFIQVFHTPDTVPLGLNNNNSPDTVRLRLKNHYSPVQTAGTPRDSELSSGSGQQSSHRHFYYFDSA